MLCEENSVSSRKGCALFWNKDTKTRIKRNCSLRGRLSYLPTPPLGQDMTQGQFFKRSLTGLNSEFSFSYTSCLTKAEEHSLSYYLPIAGGRIIGFIPFPRVLVLCEMQLASSRIWTRVAVSISYDDNHYTTGTPRGRLSLTAHVWGLPVASSTCLCRHLFLRHEIDYLQFIQVLKPERENVLTYHWTTWTCKLF